MTRILAAPAAALDASPNGRLVVDLAPPGLTIGIFRLAGGALRAFENTCPHQGGPVCQGLRIDAVREVLNDARASTGFTFDPAEPRIVCPWHGFEFSLADGAHPANPSIRLRQFPVEQEGDQLYVWI